MPIRQSGQSFRDFRCRPSGQLYQTKKQNLTAHERSAAEPQPTRKHLPRRHGDTEKNSKNNSQSENLNTEDTERLRRTRRADKNLECADWKEKILRDMARI